MDNVLSTIDALYFIDLKKIFFIVVLYTVGYAQQFTLKNDLKKRNVT